MSTLLQTIIFGTGAGSLDGLLALGIVLVFRTTGVLNFAQAATGTLAAYVAYAVASGRPAAWLWLAVPAAIAVGAATGGITYVVVGRVRNSHLVLAPTVATLALAILLQQVVRIGWGGTAGAFPQPLAGTAWSVGGVVVPGLYLAALGTAGALATGLGFGLRYTTVGTMIRALSDNGMAARLCGANVAALHAGLWATAGALAAVAGLFAAQIVFDPSFLDPFLLGALVAAVVGRLRSLSGAFLGAIGLEVARNLLGSYLPGIAQYTQTALLLALVAVLLFAPRGFVADMPERTV